MNSSKLTRSTLMVFLMINALILFFYITIGFIDNQAFLISNYLILVISSAGVLYKVEQYYSLSKFFYLYSFFFFGIVPYLDYATNNYYWDGAHIDGYYFVITNIIIILSLILYFFGYIISRSNVDIESIIKKEQVRFSFIQRHIKKTIIFLLIVSLVASYLILAKEDFNFFSMLFRGLAEEGRRIIEAPIGTIELLFYGNIVTPLPVLALLLFGYVSFGRKQLYIKAFFIVFLTLAFVFVAPTSVPRFLAIALYLSILLQFTSVVQKRYVFQLGSIFGLLIIMPFLDKFRRFDPETFTMSIDFSFLSQGHFDGYQNFVRLISLDYVTYGYQLIGALGFFIPRSIWEGKPIGSGSTLATQAHLYFENISMPFVAEGFINFHIFGSIVFVFVFGYFSGKLDHFYWTLKKYLPNHSFYGVYYLLLGMSFFILRGDLMSSTAYTVAILGSYMTLLYYISHSIIKLRK